MWTWLSNPLCCSIGLKQQGSCHVHSFFATLRVLISRKTQKEANEILGEIERKVRQGSYAPSKSVPNFSAVADIWLASKEPNIRHSTHQQYQGHIENHLKPYFGEMKVPQITFEVIEGFKRQSLEKDVTPATLKKLFVTLTGILNYAVRVRYIDHNPAIYVERPKAKSLHNDQEGMNILRPEEIRALLDAAASEKDRVLFMTAVLTGMREGELLGLKWDDLDWHNGQIQVRRTYNHTRFYEPKTKTSKRKIDLAPELIQRLKEWKLACPPGDLNLVFPTSTGTPEDAMNMLKRQFLPALRRAGLPRMRFHDLRHTYASLLIDQGEHPKYIQTQMGHSSINVTMDVYGHLMNSVKRESANRLGEAVLGGKLQTSGSKMVADDQGEMGFRRLTD